MDRVRTGYACSNSNPCCSAAAATSGSEQETTGSTRTHTRAGHAASSGDATAAQEQEVH